MVKQVDQHAASAAAAVVTAMVALMLSRDGRFDDLRRPGRSQRLLLGAWNAFHFAWPVTSQLAVLAAACFLSLQLLGARRASGSGIFAVVFLGMLTVR